MNEELGPRIDLEGGDSEGVGAISPGAMWAELCGLKDRTTQVVDGVGEIVTLLQKLLEISEKMLEKGDDMCSLAGEMKDAGQNLCEAAHKSNEAVCNLEHRMRTDADRG